MQHKLYQFHARTLLWHKVWLEGLLCLFLVLIIVVEPTAAAMRFQERSLYMNSTLPGATTSYTVAFRYMSPQLVGSVDMLFCVDPIPYHPCVTPSGLDVSNAILSQQTGEDDFAILSKSTNHIVLTRLPGMITPNDSLSSYKFDNIVNSTDTSQAFAIRLRSHTSTDVTGPQVDFGSVRGQVTPGVVIETQVPPMLIFCVAEEVSDDCTSTNKQNYSDMGTLSPSTTLTAQSQMAVGTNASGGFAITANGTPMSAGTHVIDSPSSPTESRPGKNQFGINLVANNTPSIGTDPQGTWANAVASPDYGMTDRYKYKPGDVVAYSPNVSLMKKFTVSYIVNSSENLHPGVYTTTITYIASGRF